MLRQMGLIEEAREAWRELMQVNPSYSLKDSQLETPYENLGNFERIVEGLRKAGLPEKIETPSAPQDGAGAADGLDPSA
jgi:hypothetical protein